MDDRIKLTRRKALAGLATVGAAGLGAGLGTSALFSDTESFDNNSIQAGRLNMQVTVDNILHSTAIVRDNTAISPKDTADGNSVTITVSDLKPGDWLILEWEAEVFFNPGYVQVTSVDGDYANQEGATPESETDTSSPGDLGDALLSTVWGDYQPSGPSRADLDYLDPTTDLNDTGLTDYEIPDTNGVTGSGAHYTTMNEAHDVYKTGVLLRDRTTGDPLEVGPGGGKDPASFWQLLELPTGVGNDVQGDVLTFTLRFDAEQVRNNPTPFSGT